MNLILFNEISFIAHSLFNIKFEYYAVFDAYLSNRESFNPIEDSVICVRGSPLGSHVTRTVDSCESELAVFTGLNIAANLTVHEVLVPGVLNLPVFILDPGLSAVSADYHISIS